MPVSKKKLAEPAEPSGMLGHSYAPLSPRAKAKPAKASAAPRTPVAAASAAAASRSTSNPSSTSSRSTVPRRNALKIDILQLMDHPAFFGAWFKPRDSWFPWRVVMAAAHGLPIERTGDPDGALRLFKECTGRKLWPTQRVGTLVVCAGQRSGKSRIAGLNALDLACLHDYQRWLSPGERGFLPVIAADRKQARVVFNYTSAFVGGSDVFRSFLMPDGELKESLRFSHGIDIEVMTASFRTTRGYSNIGGIFDEIAYYQNENSANPDFEIVSAVRRGTLTIPGAMLIMISSPYARRGVLWETFRSHWGQEDPNVLFWKAPTWVMNRTITRADLNSEFERDPERANADYGAEFRRDVERYVSLEVLAACVDHGRHSLPPRKEINYVGFVDPSGGSQDAFTIAIGHRHDDSVIIDLLNAWPPPFSPDSVVQEACAIFKMYGIVYVSGDKYAGEWPTERFAAHGIVYESAGKAKSELYRDTLPMLNAHRVSLPDDARLRREFYDLERRTTGSGRDVIDHPPGGHDDRANSVAGVIATLCETPEMDLTWG